MHGADHDRPAAPVDAPRPGAAGHATPPAEAGAPFAAWCRQLSPADVIDSTLMATTRNELGACIRAWMHVYDGAAWSRVFIRDLLPVDWPRTPMGHPPNTFPQLVAAVRRQLEDTDDPGRDAYPAATGAHATDQ